METNKILSAHILDLIFDDRNKDYGAYELRKTYQKRIIKALIITGMFILLVLGGTVIARSVKTDPKNRFTIREEVILQNLPEKEPEPLPEPERRPEPEPVRTEQHTTLRIVEDNQVTEPPPTQDELENAKIDVKKQDGIDDGRIVDNKGVDDNKGVVEVKKDPESDVPLTFVEIPAKFIGNWETFLRRNLNAQTPVDNGATSGRYTIRIQFVVDKEGNVSDIKPLTNHGYGMEQEAMRVLKKATKWDPAIQNGYKAKAYHVQLITFEILDDE